MSVAREPVVRAGSAIGLGLLALSGAALAMPQGLPVAPPYVAPPAPMWREVPQLSDREGHALAYDEVRGEVVLFGGHVSRSSLVLGDTWIWDGTSWERREPQVSPSSRTAHAMAFDPVRREVLLVGGASADAQGNAIPLGDVWSWDGREWRRLPGPGPGTRFSAAMCADPVRGRVVVFGGARERDPSGIYWIPLDDTWEWDGTAWAQRAPPTVPEARRWAEMAYCAASQRVVMFGGDNGFNAFSRDTWEWDGTDWRRFVNSPNPGLRAGAPMAPDPTTGRVLLHGGGNRLTDTWEWDGAAWRQLAPPGVPPARDAPRLATDTARGQIVLFGGDSGTLEPRRDTWVWDGATWTQAGDYAVPWVGTFAVAYDAARDETVLCGQTLAGPMETWVLRDGMLAQKPAATQPTSRFPQAMAYHAGSTQIVLYGGGSGLTDTWVWDGDNWTQWQGGSGPSTFCGRLTYDGHRDKIVATCGATMDIWEWDPVSGWQRLPANRSPPLRGGYDIAYDPIRREVVLYGGLSWPTYFTDTWVWDGQDWHQRQPKRTPPPTTTLRMAFVPALGGVAMVDAEWAVRGKYFPDTWLWDGADWRPLQTPQHPAQFADVIQADAYDVGRQRWLAFGTQSMRVPTGVYELSTRTLAVDQPYPRPGESLRLDAHLASQAGSPMVLALSSGAWPGVPARPMPGLGGAELLPLAFDPLLLQSLGLGLVRALDAHGRASFALTVPASPALAGLRLHAAGFTLAPGPAVGAVTSGVALGVVQ